MHAQIVSPSTVEQGQGLFNLEDELPIGFPGRVGAGDGGRWDVTAHDLYFLAYPDLFFHSESLTYTLPSQIARPLLLLPICSYINIIYTGWREDGFILTYASFLV